MLGDGTSNEEFDEVLVEYVRWWSRWVGFEGCGYEGADGFLFKVALLWVRRDREDCMLCAGCSIIRRLAGASILSCFKRSRYSLARTGSFAPQAAE